MVASGGFKTNVSGGEVVVLGWLFALTKETFLAEPAGDCPVDSILLFVDILLAPNTDK